MEATTIQLSQDGKPTKLYLLTTEGEPAKKYLVTKGEKPAKWYISGPITGYDMAERRKAFEKLEQNIKEFDVSCEVFNPLKNGLPEEATYSDHMMCDLEALVESDIVVVMAGWKHSRGCLNELKFATRLKLPILGENNAVAAELQEAGYYTYRTKE